MARNLRGKKNIPNIDKTAEDELKRKVGQYEGKSENELKDELFKIADEERKNGNLNDQMLNEFVKKAAPMMTGEQRAKMTRLVNMLKSKQ